MPFKDDAYFLKLDLNRVAEKIRDLGKDRGISEVFGDAIEALLRRAELGEVSEAEVRHVLGEPDSERQSPRGKILEYRWIGIHGGAHLYSSATPFLVRDGRLLGLGERDEGT